MNASEARQLLFKVSLDELLVDVDGQCLTGDYFLTYAESDGKRHRWELLGARFRLELVLQVSRKGIAVKVRLKTKGKAFHWKARQIPTLTRTFELVPRHDSQSQTSITCVAIPLQGGQPDPIEPATAHLTESYFETHAMAGSTYWRRNIGGNVTHYLRVNAEITAPGDYALHLGGRFDAAYGVELDAGAPRMRIRRVITTLKEFRLDCHVLRPGELQMVLHLEHGKVHVIEASPVTTFETFVATPPQDDAVGLRP